jgi:membrane protease YdiL (CAAX protease family)
MPLTQNPETIKAFILAFSVTSFGFILYHAITNSPSFMLWKSLSVNNTHQIIIQRLIGVFFFGFVSLFVISFTLHSDTAKYGTSLPNFKTFLWLIILSIVIIPMNYYNSKNLENLEQYPQIRNSEWTFPLLLLSAISWIAYLFAYEFMFRGFLLFSSLPLLGLWPSILLNTAIYSLVHIPKGNKETLGAIPFGILISYLAIETGTFWIAFFAHVILALSNEWFSLRTHPEMLFKKPPGT